MIKQKVLSPINEKCKVLQFSLEEQLLIMKDIQIIILFTCGRAMAFDGTSGFGQWSTWDPISSSIRLSLPDEVLVGPLVVV